MMMDTAKATDNTQFSEFFLLSHSFLRAGRPSRAHSLPSPPFPPSVLITPQDTSGVVTSGSIKIIQMVCPFLYLSSSPSSRCPKSRADSDPFLCSPYQADPKRHQKGAEANAAGDDEE